MDGRKFCARSGAAIATIITVAGLELAGAGAAHAAPAPRVEDDVDAARALADRLAGQAGRTGDRRDKVQVALDRVEKRMRALTVDIKRERRTSRSLTSSIAGLAGDSYDVGRGTVAPSTLDDPQADTLLTTVVIVSEDTDGLAEQMTSSDQRLVTMSQRRVTLRQQLQDLRVREQKLASTEARLQQRADDAEARVSDLIGGPAVEYALSKVGNSYSWGAMGPSSFDCSGLTMAAWSQAGVSLPHNSQAQYSSGRQISESELQPGDLVFYYSPISHVGMYIGDGQIVHALNPGSGVVQSDLHSLPYVGAVRPG